MAERARAAGVEAGRGPLVPGRTAGQRGCWAGCGKEGHSTCG